jgi:hypothetical protein
MKYTVHLKRWDLVTPRQARMQRFFDCSARKSLFINVAA